jgi:hypothetical protein
LAGKILQLQVDALLMSILANNARSIAIPNPVTQKYENVSPFCGVPLRDGSLRSSLGNRLSKVSIEVRVLS